MLVAAKRPVLYAGQGVHWAEAWDELKQLAELLAIPVTHQPAGQERVPRDASARRSAPAASPSRRRCITSSTRRT